MRTTVIMCAAVCAAVLASCVKSPLSEPVGERDRCSAAQSLMRSIYKR